MMLSSKLLQCRKIIILVTISLLIAIPWDGKAVAFNKDSTRLVVEVNEADISDRMRLYDITSQNAAQKQLVDVPGIPVAQQFSDDGTLCMISSEQDGYTSLFDAASGRELLRVEGTHPALDENNRSLATTTDDTVLVYDIHFLKGPEMKKVVHGDLTLQQLSVLALLHEEKKKGNNKISLPSVVRQVLPEASGDAVEKVQKVVSYAYNSFHPAVAASLHARFPLVLSEKRQQDENVSQEEKTGE